MKEGIFRVYRRYVDEHGQAQSRQVARFIFYGQNLTALEDHDGLIEGLAPDGRVTDRTLERLNNMASSAYWHLVNEYDLQAGEHNDLLPEVDDAGPPAWPAT